MKHWLWLVVTVAAVVTAPRAARADVTAAARAFAQGQAAQLEGNYASAAEHFELAFALQPSKEALRSAARMHMSAKNFARAATHAQALLDRFGDDVPSTELARSILEEVAPNLAKYEVVCAPECALSVDGLAYFVDASRRHHLYLKPGRVTLEAHFASGRTTSRSLATSAGDTARIELEMPPAPRASSPKRNAAQPDPDPARPAPSPARHEPSGLPPVVPWLTGAASVACGGVALWAAIDTQRKHDDYVAHPTEDGWNQGLARQRLTNVLAASTAVLGAATITLAFFVRDSSKPSVGVSPTFGPRSASVAVNGSF